MSRRSTALIGAAVALALLKQAAPVQAQSTPSWFILDQLNSTRSFNYLMLPSEVIGHVEVYESPQADFEEGGIGGTINVGTRNPLDSEPMTTYLPAQGAYTEMSDELDPQASGLFSWRNGTRWNRWTRRWS